ncbi:MAG TPA: hypothetical protein VGM88_27720 [Kofleriaceae bacterium]
MPAPALVVFLGVFDPGLPAHAPFTNAALTPVPHAGVVRVLAPEKGDPPSGAVHVIQPLLGKIADGTVDKGRVTVADFAYDQRDGDDSVIVTPATGPAAIVPLAKGDAVAIRAVLHRDPALAGVGKALVGLELAGVDLDGDKQPDAAITYGCNAWFDGICQSHGATVFVKRKGRWVVVE